MDTAIKCLSISLLICLMNPLFGGATQVTLLYTGETHAALHPCDCPVEPYGGIARRATVIRQERERDPDLLLMDAGGTFAGGIFDEATQGEVRDQQRTRTYLEAMRLMGYDAMAMGDEELQYGSEFLSEQSSQVPVLSANVFLTSLPNASQSPRRLFPPFLIRKIKGIRFAILGLTTPEAAKRMPEDLVISDPIAAYREILPQLRAQSDVIIVLSHLGEALSRQLVDEIPDIDILINAHRKQTREAFERIGETYWLQFNYQGQKLGKFRFDWRDGRIADAEFEQLPLDSSVPDDPEMVALLRNAATTTAPAKLELDLYVMALCPYAPAAERAVADVIQSWKTVLDWHIYFIVQERDGFLQSLRGDEEVQESRIQATISRYYPDRLWQYLQWRHTSVPGTPWREGATQLGLHTKRLEMALESGQADEILREHAWRVQRLQVVDSPTLYINNQVYTGAMRPEVLTKALCAKLDGPRENTPCASLPECFTDADCEKKGFVGICTDMGTPQARCQHEKAVEIPLTVIRETNAYLSNEEDILRSTRSMFPGVQVTLIEASGSQGVDLIQRFGIQRLPAYLFGAEILKSRNLERVKPGLRKVQDRYVVNPTSVGAPVWVTRPRMPYRIDLFAQPLSPNAIQAWISVEASLRDSTWIPYLHYLLEYQAAEEEAARQKVIQTYYPDTLRNYLRTRVQTLESSYWEEAIVDVGLDPQRIKELAKREGDELLNEDRTWARQMQLGGEVALVVENREAATLQNIAQLRILFQRITNRTLQ